jgi:ankyrin repeat protein
MRNLVQQAVRYVKCNNRKRLAWLLTRHTHLRTAVQPGDDESLLFTAFWSNLPMLPWLLEQGVDPDTPENDDGTLLMGAAAANDLALGRLLLAHGANVNARNQHGETAFSYACANNSLAVAQLLFANGADINTVDAGGGSPLDWAVCWSSPEFREWLASVGGKRHDNGYAPWPWPPQGREVVALLKWDRTLQGNWR